MLTSKGELGGKETKGNFSLTRDTLFLQFSSADIRPSADKPNGKDTLLIYGGRCLISIGDGYDYCKQKTGDELHISTHRKIIRN